MTVDEERGVLMANSNSNETPPMRDERLAGIRASWDKYPRDRRIAADAALAGRDSEMIETVAADFLSFASDALPALLAEVDRLKTENAELRAGRRRFMAPDHIHQWHSIAARWETTPDGGGDKRYRTQCSVCGLIWEHA